MTPFIVHQHRPTVLNSKIPDCLRDRVLKIIPTEDAVNVEFQECDSERYVLQKPFLAWEEPGSRDPKSNKATSIQELNRCIAELVYQHEHGKIFDFSGQRI